MLTVVSIASVLFAIPLIAMQLTGEVNWSVGDFFVWGVLLGSASAALLWVMRRVPRSRWLGAAPLIGIVFIYIWAELAVGVFTSLGS